MVRKINIFCDKFSFPHTLNCSIYPQFPQIYPQKSLIIKDLSKTDYEYLYNFVAACRQNHRVFHMCRKAFNVQKSTSAPSDLICRRSVQRGVRAPACKILKASRNGDHRTVITAKRTVGNDKFYAARLTKLLERAAKMRVGGNSARKH